MRKCLVSNMVVKNIVDEDFVNYKKPAMFIGFPSCSFKCDKECGKPVCQNGALASAQNIDINTGYLIERFLKNPISQAIVCGGLEPFDSLNALIALHFYLRRHEKAKNAPASDFVIYTGYTEDELWNMCPDVLSSFHKDGRVIIKYGRYRPNQQPHFDDVLGVMLSSDNQYATYV